MATVRPLLERKEALIVGHSQLLDAIKGDVGMAAERVPWEAVARWETAYRAYVEVESSAAWTRGERLMLADALQAVADAWRDIATTPGLDWWMLAALSAAAETAEQQARQFQAPRPHGGRDGGR
jgi:hypothetical protein